MPKQVDLGPDNYAVRTKRGIWVRRDLPWMFVVYGAFAVGVVVFAWWHRSELTAATLFGACAMFSFLAGMAVALWLKRFDR